MTARVLLLLAALGLAACATTVETADRGEGLAPRDPALVQVLEQPASVGDPLVSFSVWEVNRVDTLPAAAPEDVVTAMRTEAAQRGAARLFLERIDGPRRKAFFGLGAAPPGAERPHEPVCDYPSFHTRAGRAVRDAQRCLAAVAARRPGFRAAVAVVMQLDAWGRVMQAAPTPESTRDGEAHACVLDALHATDFGAPPGLTCAAMLGVAYPVHGD